MQLLLIGDGPLRLDIKQKVSQLGLSDHVVFAGLRSDVPRLMLSAMDAFVMPSLYEGLGLVLIEAQAAGLPCIFSDVVPHEADLVKPLLQRLSLSQPPAAWADAVLLTRDNLLVPSRESSLCLVEQSPFSIHESLKRLQEIYPT
jgi:glycosyltransferase involved in cell wall biosynthesis